MTPLGPSPTPVSVLLTENISGLQAQTDMDNYDQCVLVNGQIQAFLNWQTQEIPGETGPPMPTSIPWDIFNPALGAALFNATQSAAQGMKPGNNAFTVYDESMAIMPIPGGITIPPNATSVSVDPTTHMPDFTYAATPTIPAPPANPVGAAIPGMPGFYVALPNDPRVAGQTFTDDRGTFVKIVQPSMFAPNGIQMYYLMPPAPTIAQSSTGSSSGTGSNTASGSSSGQTATGLPTATGSFVKQ